MSSSGRISVNAVLKVVSLFSISQYKSEIGERIILESRYTIHNQSDNCPNFVFARRVLLQMANN